MEPEKLLTSPDLDPTSGNLKNELGRWFSIYETLTETLSKPPYDISPEWRFYKDGGAWLCKMRPEEEDGVLDISLEAISEVRVLFH